MGKLLKFKTKAQREAAELLEMEEAAKRARAFFAEMFGPGELDDLKAELDAIAAEKAAANHAAAQPDPDETWVYDDDDSFEED